MKHLLDFSAHSVNENATLDSILDKISACGMKSLTPGELNYLNNHSQGKSTPVVRKYQRFPFSINGDSFFFIYSHSDGHYQIKFTDAGKMDLEGSDDFQKPVHHGEIHGGMDDFVYYVTMFDMVPFLVQAYRDNEEYDAVDEDGEPMNSITFEEDYPEWAVEFKEIMQEIAKELSNSIAQ